VPDGARPLRTVFLDRDGVINRKAPEGSYVTSWEEFAFLPGALDGLAALADAGLRTIVVTNQRGIARGAMTLADLEAIHARMRDAVAQAGGRIDAIYFCPHEGPCLCRKPAPGMLLDAARDHGLSLPESAIVGDRAHDVEAGAAVGTRCVLVRGYDEPCPPVDYVADDLRDAARWLVAAAAAGAP
jgi:D-glycero-D-manno-heptose 1,7-bisphosphate phosphatase